MEDAAKAKVQHRASMWLAKTDSFVSKNQRGVEVGDLVRRRLTKKLSKDIMTMLDTFNRKDKNKEIDVTFTKHPWAKHWTRQVYKVVAYHTPNPLQRIDRVTLEKVPPFIVGEKAGADDKKCYEFVSNILKIPSKNICRSTYHPILPDNDSPHRYVAMTTFPDEADESLSADKLSVREREAALLGYSVEKMIPKNTQPQQGKRFKKIQAIEFSQDKVPDQDKAPDQPPQPAQPPPSPPPADEPPVIVDVVPPPPPAPPAPPPPPPDISDIPPNIIEQINREQQRLNNTDIVYTMPGWKFVETPGDGNCYYRALADAFNSMVYKARANWSHTEIRRELTGSDTGGWAGAREVYHTPEYYSHTVLALVHIQRQHQSAKYRYIFYEGGVIKEEESALQTPMHWPIFRLAYTGNHYMAVYSEPPGKRPNRRVEGAVSPVCAPPDWAFKGPNLSLVEAAPVSAPSALPATPSPTRAEIVQQHMVTRQRSERQRKPVTRYNPRTGK
jgi:hypothetical protein